MTKSIDSVPESITRQQYLGLIESVGFTVNQLVSLEFRADGIYAEVVAYSPDGKQLYDRNEAVKHKIYIPVKDPS